MKTQDERKLTHTEVGGLDFTNQDAVPQNVQIKCTAASVAYIMAWYGAYYAGDNYTVTFNGVNIPMTQDGECTLSLNELAAANAV